VGLWLRFPCPRWTGFFGVEFGSRICLVLVVCCEFVGIGRSAGGFPYLLRRVVRVDKLISNW